MPGDDPPSTEADGRNDALFQHCVDGETAHGQPVSDLGDRHSTAHVGTALRANGRFCINYLLRGRRSDRWENEGLNGIVERPAN